MKKYDYLLVGAGLYNSIFAYRANQLGKKCLVIDKRSHLGGNIYCENLEGINVHKYGAHIFHTSNKKVWDFVNSIVEFNRFTNSPIANYKGEYFNLPFNMNTFHQMWGVRTPEEARLIIEEQKKEALEELNNKNIKSPRNLEEQATLLVGKDIFEKLIKGYTEKQWGRDCKQIPAFIIRRIPVRFVYDNNYFNDTYQGIPVGGYNSLINGLLKDIDVKLNCNFLKDKKALTDLAERIIFTGPIDEYYDYCFGKLEYRSLRFENEILDTPNFQGNAVINFTEREVPYTRILEHKHFESFGKDIYANPKTVITKEYSLEWQEGNEPYYPINDKKNNNLFHKYKDLAKNERKVRFAGRLGDYKYYDMHHIVEKVLDLEID